MSLFVYKPHTKVIRTNIRGERIVRHVNFSGFLDIDHFNPKPFGVYRIGFFGDSYVEAKQVLLDDTFYRLIGNNLSGENIEVLAFGNSGWGTAHSFLVSQKFSDYYDLDLIVYVFSENDIGDQLFEVKKAETMPYPLLSANNQVRIDNSKAKKYIKIRQEKALLEFLYRKSYLVQNIYRRLSLLKKYGIKTSVTKDDMNMTTRILKDKYPGPNDIPSIWPEKVKNKAILLAEKVILKWKNEVEKSGKNFAIIYAPREGEWMKEEIEQDSWKAWLKRFSKSNNIDFIDPTKEFFLYAKLDKILFDDHLSVDGHIAFAESFLKWFEDFFDNK